MDMGGVVPKLAEANFPHGLTNQRHYPDLGGDTSLVISTIILFLRRHFAGKPVVVSRNVVCFLRLTVSLSTTIILTILGLQPHGKAAMLDDNTIKFFLKNLRENRVKFPEERNAFVLDIQHGCLDVTCKPAIIRLVCKMHTEKFCSFPDSFLGNSNFFKA